MPPERRAVSFGKALKSPIKKQGKSDKQPVSLDVQKQRRRDLEERIAQLRQPPRPSPSSSSSALPFPLAPREGSSALSVEAADKGEAHFDMDASAPPGESKLSNSMHSAPPLSSVDGDNRELLSELPCYEDDNPVPEPPPSPTPAKPAQATPKRRRRQKKRSEKAKGTTEERPDLVERWKETLKTLEGPLLLYKERTLGATMGQGNAPLRRCKGGCIIVEKTTLQVYSFDSYLCFKTTARAPLSTAVASLSPNRWFYTASSPPLLPSHAWRYLSAFLSFTRHFVNTPRTPSLPLRELLMPCIGGVASAFSTQRQAQFGSPVKDPLRRSLSQALQWYDALQLGINRSLDDALESIKPQLSPLTDTISTLPQPNAAFSAFEKVLLKREPQPTATGQPEPPELPKPTTQPEPLESAAQPEPPEPPTTPGRVSGYLQRLCPACFGGTEFGSSFKRGGDIHVAIDASFGHRHLKSGGDGAEFHTSYRILTKTEVDNVGVRIDAARKTPPKQYDSGVPDHIVEADREAFHAAKGDNETTSNQRFDENGLMALVCRHDIPLLAASIDTPGEQQKYAVALLEEFFRLIPSQATVGVLYDIACVVDRSIHIYNILEEDVVSRIIFATAVMHAYGHQWTCQLHYNPRLGKGFGLTDGEGTERLWSALRKLIGLERRSSRARRIWLLDRQCDAIAQNHREDLGAFIERKLIKFVHKKEAESVRQLRETKTTVKDLQALWQDQREAQASPRAVAPARLKKELAKVLKLQTEIDALEVTIASTKAAVEKLKFPPSDATMLLADLQQTHTKLKQKAEDLYTSLNIPQNHPSLANIPLEYIHTLLLARDLKYDIRKRAISTIQEYEQIDRAVGGAHEALGTRSHQLARKNMARRKTAFENSIRRFNQFCAYLEVNYKEAYNIPVPRTLPVNISSLRDVDACDLWEDVWITNSTPPPRWLTDDDVRKGIRAVTMLERCVEERQRLAKEAVNLCMWFRDELYALLVLSTLPDYSTHLPLIGLRIREHLLLVETWSNPFVGRQVFESQIALVFAELSLAPLTVLPSSSTPLHAANLLEVEMEVDSSKPNTTEGTRPVVKNSGLDAEASAVEEESEEGGEGSESSSDEEDPDVKPLRIDSDSDGEDELRFTWKPPNGLRYDLLLHQCVKKGYVHPTLAGQWRDRRLLKSLGNVFVFGAAEFGRMDSPTAWLDEDCMNGIAHLIRERNSGVECAYISTYAIPTLAKENGNYLGLWKTIRGSRYWERDVWLIPIHSRSRRHWALAVVKAKEQQIVLFDSFADRQFLSEWAPLTEYFQRVHLTIMCLVKLAQDNGEAFASSNFLCLSNWTARPLEIRRKQTNGYDCGVWVLWVISAVMRGFDYALLEESEIGAFRKYLARTIRTLPAYK
ncbi:hypothetical protein V5O48_008639 [Marasmius crinis-equi]|uniref:Ubiquitin-like protease family profile domain-containing protein n=1 Tax=Marasmius crinis-equi TaxID=585013 RepID=A0ABR3FDC7_9AGAR